MEWTDFFRGWIKPVDRNITTQADARKREEQRAREEELLIMRRETEWAEADAARDQTPWPLGVREARTSDTHRLYAKVHTEGDSVLSIGCSAEGCEYDQVAVFLSLSILEALESDHVQWVDSRG